MQSVVCAYNILRTVERLHWDEGCEKFGEVCEDDEGEGCCGS